MKKMNFYKPLKQLKASGKLLLLILAFIAFKPTNLKATHVMGADITYTCLDSFKFEVFVTYYRDCRGVAISLPSLTLKACNNQSTRNITLNKIKARDVTPVCATEPSRCNPSNTFGTGKGIEEHRYKVIVDIKKDYPSIYKDIIDEKCCWITFETGQCCRNNNAISTGVGGHFYTYADINLCEAPCNSSPDLTTEPIAFMCCNQPYFYNMGALDRDFDSLSYHWAPALNGPNQQTTPSSPLSFKEPFTSYYPGGRRRAPNPLASPPIGVFLDFGTGDIVLTPTKCDEVAVAVIEIREWKKNDKDVYEHVGTTRRDMQFWVEQCPGNNPPYLIPDQNKYTWEVCEGSQLCFKIKSEDKVVIPPPPQQAPPPDSVKLSWNRGIPGATFKITNKGQARTETAEFCWQPKIGDARDVPYTFTVTARDDACPLNAVFVKAFRIFVRPKAQTERLIDTLPCGRYAIESKLPAGFDKPATFRWDLLDENRQNVFDKRTGFIEGSGTYFSFNQLDTLNFRKGGRYFLTHYIDNKYKCSSIYEDTVDVPEQLQVELVFGPDTFICAGTTLALNGTIKNGNSPFKYQWFAGGKKLASDTFAKFDLVVPPWTLDTTLALEITDAIGCKDMDSTRVFPRPNPKVDMGPDQRICTYDSVLLTPNASLAYWDDPRDDTALARVQGDTLLWTWKYGNSSDTISRDTAHTFNVEGYYYATVTDSIGCTYTDTFYLDVNDTVSAYAGMDQTVCWDDLLELGGTGLDTAGNSNKTGFVAWNDISTAPPARSLISNLDTTLFNIRQTTDFDFYVQIVEGGVACEDYDTVSITVNPLPVLDMPEDKSFCCDAQNPRLTVYTYTPKGGTWTIDQNPSWIQFSSFKIDSTRACELDQTVTRYATYTYQDPATKCINRDSILLTVNKLPKLELRDRTFCQDIEIVDMENELISFPVAHPSAIGTNYNWQLADPKPGNYTFTDLVSSQTFGTITDFELDISKDNFSLERNGGTLILDSDTIRLVMTYTDINSCGAIDTANVAVVRVPKISFDGFPILCWDDGLVSLKEISNSAPNTGSWSVLDTTDPTYSPASDLGGIINGDSINTQQPGFKFTSAQKFRMRYFDDATGCPAFGDTTLFIYGLPQITMPADAVFCETEGNQNILADAIPKSGGVWETTSSGAIAGNQFSPNGAGAGVHNLIYNVTNPQGCVNKDSFEVTVHEEIYLNILTPPDTLCFEPTLVLDIDYETNAPGVEWFAFPGSDINGQQFSALPSDANVVFTIRPDNDSVKLWLTQASTQETPGNVCPFVTTQYSVLTAPIPDITIDVDDPDGCNPHSAQFTPIANNRYGEATANYTWDFGDGGTDNVQTPNYVFTTDGTNDVTLSVLSEHGCSEQFTIPIDVYPIPVADFTPNPNNTTTVALPRFIFTNNSTVSPELNSSISNYYWDFGDIYQDPTDTSTEISPTYWYGEDTATYDVNLVVVTNHGCSDSITKPVIVGPDLIIYIPTAFSPDGGGPFANEFFKFAASGFDNYDFKIFNRWGEKLFESVGSLEDYFKLPGWDGTYKGEPCQQDVYVYVVEVTNLDGELFKYSGTVTLLK